METPVFDSDYILNHCVHHRVVTPFVQRYGRLFQPQRLPKPYRQRRPKKCFENAYEMAQHHPVTYVEGYALLGDLEKSEHHAWCVDQDGKVLDNTFHGGKAYFGIPFKTAYLVKTICEHQKNRGPNYAGLLDEWEDGFPLIKGLAEFPESWLEFVVSPEHG